MTAGVVCIYWSMGWAKFPRMVAAAVVLDTVIAFPRFVEMIGALIGWMTS